MGKKFKVPGFYWLYYKPTKDWTVAEFDGKLWSFVGSDVSVKDISNEYHIGMQIITPTYHPSK